MDTKAIRLERLRKIIADRFEGNAGRFADTLGIKRPQMSRWITKNEAARQGISEDSARSIEKKLSLEPGWLDMPLASRLLLSSESLLPSSDTNAGNAPLESPPEQPDELEEASLPHPYRRVPVVGEVQGGMDGYLLDLEYPVGHGDDYVDHPTRDEHAYSLRVRGESMRPRIKSGELIVVEPSREVMPGNDVVVLCRDGRKMVKEFLYRRGDEFTFGSINGDFKPISLRVGEIDAIHRVGGIIPR